MKSNPEPAADQPNIHYENEVDDATRHDRTGPDGRQHGAPADQTWTSMRGVRPFAAGGEGADQGPGGRSVFVGGARKEAATAARHLVDGPGRGRGPVHRQSAAAARPGR